MAADTTAADTPGADTTTADTTQIEPAEIGRVPGGRSRGDRAARVVVTAAELLTPAGSACPAFPRPPSDRDPRHGLVVAVALAVDSLGQVDTTNVRVVQAPGTPPPPPEFFPQVYIVSTTLREEGEFDGPVEAYDSLVAGDVRRHLATLRFRPASKGGRPTRATVLVSCQAR